MKIKKTIMITILLSFSISLLAEEHSHHDNLQKSELQLNHGKKWSTDLPLRQGMESINRIAKENSSEIHTGKFSNESYNKMGLAMKEQTDLIFKNCKLSPAADKELHKILIVILNSEKEFMDSAKTTNKQEAFDSLLKSLDLYDNYFQHSGWIPAQ